MAMTTVEILRAARALIDTPEKWTTRTYARNAVGSRVATNAPSARRFCARGAIYRVTGSMNSDGAAEAALWEALPAALLKQASRDGLHPVTVFNDDEATHADILAAFDRAIAACEPGQ